MPRSLTAFSLALLLGLPAAARCDDKDVPEGFQPLFNGKDLTGWKVFGGKMDVWKAEPGLLVVDGKGGGWLMTEKEYGDFELRVEYKVPKAGNSGVALRAPLKGNPAYEGMEIQILGDPWYKDSKNFKGLKPTQLTGSIYDVVPPAKEAIKPAGEWNRMRIVAKGRQITIEVNGTKIVDANLDDLKEHYEKHPGLQRTAGHLGLQSHDGRVEFRKIYLKAL
jgi:hypothetical protein